MNIFKSFLAVLLLIATVASCKKSNDSPASSIQGSWVGALGYGSDVPSGLLKYNIKAGNVLERIGSNGSVSATGTWQLNGTSFTGIYTYPSGTIVNIIGTLDQAKNKLSGTWENNGQESGNWYADKK